MTQFKEVARQLEKARLIAILRKIPLQQAIDAAKAAVTGGVRVVEVTMDSPDALDIIRTLRAHYDNEVLIGAGTVLTPQQLSNAIQANADLLFSPHFDEVLVTEAHRLNRMLIPGVTTPSEIVKAQTAGAQVLKLFPAAPLGPGYLKDILGPLGGISVIPTGGITVENAGSWINAGAIAVGMGSSLLLKSDIDSEDWSGLTSHVRSAMKYLRSL